MLSKRDKAAISEVLRSSDMQWHNPYQFTVTAFGDVQFARPGTTSRKTFTDVHCLPQIEAYIAELAVYAYANLIRKYGEAARSMIDKFIVVNTFGSGPQTQERLSLADLLNKHGYSFEAILRCLVGTKEKRNK